MGRPAIIEREPRPLDDDELVGRVFRALGDPTRLRILELLLQRERTQKELVAELGARQGRLSEHVGCLAWCGFVTAERQGRTICYRVGDPGVARILQWARTFLEGNEAGIAACRKVR